MDRLPLLVYNGVTIGQSKTIGRFVAKKLGFFGSTDEEGALIDMITEHVRDIKQKYGDAKAGKQGDELAAAKAAFMATDLPTHFAKLEKCVGAGGYSVGGKISLADVTLQIFVQDFFDDKAGAAAAVEGCPNISAVVATVATAAAAWIASRPATAM